MKHHRRDTTWREKLVTALLRDVYRLARKDHRDGSEELSESRCDYDIKTVVTRCACEGGAFLTDTLPLLGKALDGALSGNTPEFSCPQGFERDGEKLPRFMSGFFSKVFHTDGQVLPSACPRIVKYIRQVAYLFYKLRVDYAPAKVQRVLDAFLSNEERLATVDLTLQRLHARLEARKTDASVG